jgi:S1-C subfamily serine protease
MLPSFYPSPSYIMVESSDSDKNPIRTPERKGSVAQKAVIALVGAGAATGLGFNAIKNDTIQKETNARFSALDGEMEAERARIARSLQNAQERIANLELQVTMDDLAEAADIVTPSTVRVQGEVENWYGGVSRVTGSGTIILDNQGRKYILTNAHVTEDSEIMANEHEDWVYDITLYNGDDYSDPITFKAQPVVLSDGQRAHFTPEGDGSNFQDIAILEIPADIELPESAKGVRIQNLFENPLNEGDPVIAVGNPFNERDSVTHGIISHRARFGDIEPGNVFLQTDAPINPGNSGGGLFSVRKVRDPHGGVRLVVELVGMNTWGYRGGDGVSGSIRADVLKAALEKCGISIMSSEEKELFEKEWEKIEKAQEEIEFRDLIQEAKDNAAKTDHFYEKIEKDISKIKQFSQSEIKRYYRQNESVMRMIKTERDSLDSIQIPNDVSDLVKWIEERKVHIDAYEAMLQTGHSVAKEREAQLNEAEVKEEVSDE